MSSRILKEHRVRSFACLHCGKILDAASGVDDDDMPPKPGDVSICFYCGNIAVFGDNLLLRQPTDKEIIALAGDRQLLAVQRARGIAMKKHRH